MAYADQVTRPTKKKPRAGQPVPKAYEYTPEETTEKNFIDECLKYLACYKQDRKVKEQEWLESYKMYVSWIDETRNPFLSNMFIPKTHEAVEITSAFLVGPSQTVTVRAEWGSANYRKATVAGKWLDFMWRKVLKAREKLLIGVKQGEVFGNAVWKVGFDSEEKEPWLNNTAIEDVYFDFFEPNIQESLYVFHEIRRGKDAVMKDEKYDGKDKDGNLLREQVIEGGSQMNKDVPFSSYDDAMTVPQATGKVPLLEVWTHKSIGNELLTLAPTATGWRVLRRKPNPFKWKEGKPYRPFVKLRFKMSPLPSRAYDTGGVFPTVKIQKSFNDLINQYFDGVVMINNPMTIRRRGAGINPRDLVRRPGGIVTVKDITRDIRWDQPPEMKASIVEMLNRLDSEFQQASMVANLMKSIPDNDLATEAVLGQENFNTLIKPLTDNIQDAFSEIGAMILNIAVAHKEGVQKLELFENDNEVGVLEFDPKTIDAVYDVKIEPDRNAHITKVVRQKQLIDFLKIVGADQNIQQKFPRLNEQIYREWLTEAGFADQDKFFEAPEMAGEVPGMMSGGVPAGLPAPGGAPAGLPASGEGLSPMGVIQAAMRQGMPTGSA